MGDVSDPTLRGARLDGRQAQEADLQPRGSDLRQLEAQTHRTDLQHRGRAEAGDLQLKTGGRGEGWGCSLVNNLYVHVITCYLSHKL